MDSSSSSLTPESESSSSLSPDEVVDATPTVKEDRKFYVLVVKAVYMDQPELNVYDNVNEGLKFLYEMLEKKRTGQFYGRIWAFWGQMIDYSMPIHKYHLHVGDRVFDMISTDGAEYIGHEGGPEP